MLTGKIRDFSLILQSPALARLCLCPSPQREHSLGPRGRTHLEPMFSLYLDHILDTQDPGIFYLNITNLTFSPDLFSWIILLRDTRVNTWCSVMDETQMCMLVYPAVCSMAPCHIGWIQGWEKKEGGAWVPAPLQGTIFWHGILSPKILNPTWHSRVLW